MSIRIVPKEQLGKEPSGKKASALFHRCYSLI